MDGLNIFDVSSVTAMVLHPIFQLSHTNLTYGLMTRSAITANSMHRQKHHRTTSESSVSAAEYKRRLIDVLIKMGAPEYVVCRGQRVEIKLEDETKTGTKWAKGTIGKMGVDGTVEVTFDNGDKNMFYVEEFETMFERGEVRKAR